MKNNNFTVNVITEGDSFSAKAGEKLAEKLIFSLKNNETVILDFSDSGSHTSLFFNALLGTVATRLGIGKLEMIDIKKETELDSDTWERCKKNMKKNFTDSKYRDAVKGADGGNDR